MHVSLNVIHHDSVCISDDIISCTYDFSSVLMTLSGASYQPTRIPGVKYLEKEPLLMTLPMYSGSDLQRG
jgi:hypothetical protein